MLCSICFEDILQGDDIKFANCKEFLNFNCAGLKEVNFRKISSTLKEKWTCSTYKTKNLIVSPVILPVKSQTVTNETLKNVVESMKSYEFSV